jgi:hypothetical protein
MNRAMFVFAYARQRESVGCSPIDSVMVKEPACVALAVQLRVGGEEYLTGHETLVSPFRSSQAT